MPDSISFLFFVRACFDAAVEATLRFLNWNATTVATGTALLILGYLLFRWRRGKDDAHSRVIEEFLWVIGPLVIFAVGVFFVNVIRSPFLVYRQESSMSRQQIGALQERAAVAEKELAEEKDHDRPKFEIGWGTVIVSDLTEVSGGQQQKYTSMFVAVTVINRGAQSIIKAMKVLAKLKDDKQIEGTLYIPTRQKELTFHLPNGEPIKYSVSSALAIRGTASPIPNGGQADGYVFVTFPAGLLDELSKPPTVFILEIQDVTGKTYHVEIPITGIKGTRMFSYPGLLPNP